LVFRNTEKTFVLLAGLAGLMVALGSLFDRGGAVIGFGLGLAIVGFSYWKSDALAIRAAHAVPADEPGIRSRRRRRRPVLPTVGRH
jgi:heat shock protein HtpX